MSSQLKAQYDLPLTNVSSGYFPKKMISELILPMVESKMTSGKLGKYGTDHLRIQTTVVAGKGKFRQIEGMARTDASYYIEGHGLQDLVTEEDYANVMEPFKAEEDSALALTTILFLEKEKALADVLGSTASITQNTTLVGAQQYNNTLTSDPIADFKAARAAVYNGCGSTPDTAIMSWDVWNELRFHPQILDALGFKFARPGGLEENEMIKALGVEKLFIGEAKYESAAKGQTSSLASVWGKNIVFAVCPEKAAKQQMSLGYTVRYAGQPPRKTYKWSENNPPESTAILVKDSYDQVILNVGAAYLIKNAIA